MRAYFHVFGSLILFTVLSGCSGKNDGPRTATVRIKYNNGSIYCVGNHLLRKNGEPRDRVGIWKFYFPNGKISAFLEYDKRGDLIVRKEFFETGIIKFSESVNDDIRTTIEYFENGTIRNESIIVTRTEDGEDYSTDYSTETFKEFYPNGKLESSMTFIDGDLNGPKVLYDSNGVEMITVHYRNNLIINHE